MNKWLTFIVWWKGKKVKILTCVRTVDILIIVLVFVSESPALWSKCRRFRRQNRPIRCVFSSPTKKKKKKQQNNSKKIRCDWTWFSSAGYVSGMFGRRRKAPEMEAVRVFTWRHTVFGTIGFYLNLNSAKNAPFSRCEIGMSPETISG